MLATRPTRTPTDEGPERGDRVNHRFTGAKMKPTEEQQLRSRVSDLALEWYSETSKVELDRATVEDFKHQPGVDGDLHEQPRRWLLQPVTPTPPPLESAHGSWSVGASQRVSTRTGPPADTTWPT